MNGLSLGIGAQAGPIVAELGAKLDAIDRNTARAVGMLEYPARAIGFNGSIVGIGSGTAVTTIAGPEGGKEWHLRRLSFAPQLGVAVGTAGIVIVGKSTGMATSVQGSGAIVGLVNFLEVARTPIAAQTTGGAPGFFTFSHSQVVFRYPQNIVVVWASGTDKCPLILDGEVEEVLAGTDPDR